MNAPIKMSFLDQGREKRAALHDAFCSLEYDVAKLLGAKAPKMFGQKLECLTDNQTRGVDIKSLIAARNIVAHAHLEAASRSGKPVVLWQMPHHDPQLNALVLSADGLEDWCNSVKSAIAKLKSQLSG